MSLLEISVIPIGTATTSVSSYVAEVIKFLKGKSNIKYELTSMSTIIEGDCDLLFDLAKEIHKLVLSKDVKRVVTTIKIDDRLDKPTTIEGKKRSVAEKIS